jgi:hypothetical protein
MKLAVVNESVAPVYALPALYLPPTGWFAVAAAVPRVQVVHHLPVWKGSLQMRCSLKVPPELGTTQRLTVPAQHPDKALGFGQLRISYTRPWQREHIRSVENYYRQAAYFEFYWPFLRTILETNYTYVRELNSALLEQIWHWLGLAPERLLWPRSPGALHEVRVPRWSLSPQGVPPQLPAATYYQLYGPFVPNLTVLDLLFHEGPWSIQVLQRMAPHNLQAVFSL